MPAPSSSGTTAASPVSDTHRPEAPEALDAPTDGRAARAERTRQSIVDALLSLLEEGQLQPTATHIANRAGISLRLIYHHFGDLESLFRATAQRQTERLATMVEPIPAEGLTLAERVDAFCAQRARMLEWITPVRRAAMLHEPFSEELRRARDLFVELAHAEVRRLFATELEELADHDPTLAEQTNTAVAAASSWNYWDALRVGGNDPAASQAILRLTISSLLTP